MPEQGARIEAEGIAGNDLEAARVVPGDLLERADGAVVALDRDHPPCPLREQRASEPAGARTDLDHVDAFERTGRTRDPRGQIEIEQKILAERLLAL